MADDKKPTCFVISPIGDPDTPERKRADQFLQYVVKEGIGHRFQVVRADDIAEPGMVTSQIVQYLITSELVVADLTDRNPNVMYELAIRHATQKPFVQCMARGQSLPFDIGQQRTIFFDIHDLDSVSQCKRSLVGAVEAALQQEFTDTPVGRLLDIGEFEAETPKDEILSKVLGRLDAIEAKLDRPRSWADLGEGSHMLPAGLVTSMREQVQPDAIPLSPLARQVLDIAATYLKTQPDYTAFVDEVVGHVQDSGLSNIRVPRLLKYAGRSPYFVIQGDRISLKKE
jgi:hypothetical protein